jgi:hypothetical protein
MVLIQHILLTQAAHLQSTKTMFVLYTKHAPRLILRMLGRRVASQSVASLRKLVQEDEGPEVIKKLDDVEAQAINSGIDCLQSFCRMVALRNDNLHHSMEVSVVGSSDIGAKLIIKKRPDLLCAVWDVGLCDNLSTLSTN